MNLCAGACVCTHGARGQSAVLPIEMAFCLLGDRLSLAWSTPVRLELLSVSLTDFPAFASLSVGRTPGIELRPLCLCGNLSSPFS